MNSHLRSSGRALPLVLGLVAVAAVVFFFVADPLGTSSDSSEDASRNGGAPDLLTDGGSGEAGATKPKGATATLGGIYGEGDAGAIRLRLLWVGSREPVAGQEVELLSRRGVEITKTPSDAEGRVLFPQVRPGKGYALHLKGEGFSEVLIQGISVHAQATKDLGDILIGEDVVLRGRVVDSMGRPVPGTAVSIHTIERGLATKGMLMFLAEQATSVPDALKAVSSDTEGYFAFSAVDDGTYSLVARRGGYASKHQNDVIVASKRGAGVLTIVLGSAGRATGKVTDSDGKGIAGAQVIALRDVGRRMTSNMLQREITVTEDDGSFVIDTLTAGQRYRFGVLAKGYAPVYEVSGAQLPDQGDLEKNFTLVKGGDLKGVVTDEATGKPVEGARVAIYVGSMGWGGRRDPNAKATADTRISDEKGEFMFEAMTPGPVSSAIVKAPGYVNATFSMWPPPGNQWPEIKEGECQDVKVTLKRGGSIKGIITTSENNKPVQGAEVTIMQTGWGAMASMFYGSPTSISSEEGGFELVGVPPGKYRLMAVAEGFSPAGGTEGVEIEVPEAGGTVERNLAMISAGAVAGIVVDPNGDPIPGVRIRIKAGPRNNAGQNGGGRRSGRRGMDMARRILMQGRMPGDLSDENGKFRLEGIGTGQNWIVYGESEEYVSGESKPFKLEAGQVEDLKLQMLPGGALRGRVVDENGRWLPGVRVQVGRLTEELSGSGRVSSWRADRALDPRVFTTDEEGRFLATNLKPGRQLVKASRDKYITFYKRSVTIKPGETYENYTIALSAGETLTGTVLGSDGKPLQGAMVAVTSQANPGEDDSGSLNNEDTSEDVEPAMYGRTDKDGKYKIEHIKPGTYNVVIWFARGHKAWSRDNDEAAIKREVTMPATDIDFKLNEADPNANPWGGGGGNRNRGR